MYKNDFPLLKNRIVYLDNAATTQKPKQVLHNMRKFYEIYNANPYRGVYKLSEDCTLEYENSRYRVAQFINANSMQEIVFTRNATESINLVASCLNIEEGDEILVSVAEHHSNYLPWLNTKGTVVKLDIDSDGVVTEDILRKAINRNTKLVCVNHISNVLGSKNNIKALAKVAHLYGALILVDGAQSVPHIPVDVQDLDVDFLVFSGHKMYGPMGIGVLYGKRDLLECMKPYMYGGEMIESVHWGDVRYAHVPHKFEAGTVNTVGAYGLKTAINYCQIVEWDAIVEEEHKLINKAFEEMHNIPHVKIIGSQNPEDHYGIISFNIDDVHPHDVASLLDDDGICVRAGHHCAQPLMDYLGIKSAVRMSVGLYNDEEDIDKFISSLSTIRKRMGIE